MGKTIEERIEWHPPSPPPPPPQKKKKKKDDVNRRFQKLKKKLKFAKLMVAWISNELHGTNIKRKATKKEKKNKGEILEPSDKDWQSCKTEGAEANRAEAEESKSWQDKNQRCENKEQCL